MLQHGACKGQQFDALSRMDSLIGPAGYAGAGGNIFQAANIAALASLAMPINRHMAQLCCCSACPCQNLAADDDAPTDAGADGHIDDIGAPAPGTKHVLAQTC